MPRRFSLLFALAASASAAGCVAPGPFPSLLPRAAEGDAAALEEPVRVRPDVPADGALRRRTDDLLAQARRGGAAFEGAAAAAAGAARRAGAAGGEGWIAAQQAISAAEAARAPSVTALAELDVLALARAGEPTNQQDFEALLAALAEVQRLVEAQHARLVRIRAGLGT